MIFFLLHIFCWRLCFFLPKRSLMKDLCSEMYLYYLAWETFVSLWWISFSPFYFFFFHVDSLSPSFNLKDTMNKKRACAPVSVTEYGIPITKLPEASGFMNQSLCVVILHCVREWEMYSMRCILAIPFNPLVKNKQLKPAWGFLVSTGLNWCGWSG